MRRFVRRALAPVVVTGALLFTAGPALAQRGGGGHGGGGHAGGGSFHAGGASYHAGGGGVHPYAGGAGYRGGATISGAGINHSAGFGYGGYGGYGYGGYGSLYRPYAYGGYGGFYRPYYGYGGFGFGGLYWPYYGYGIGLGSGLGYGLGGFGFGDYGLYSPYYSGLGLAAMDSLYPAMGSGGVQANLAPPNQNERPPQDNAAHLQLLVPEDAEVWIDGVKTTHTGKSREFISPTLSPGTLYSYKISVRYTNAQGKAVNDTRDIRFHGNDWFTIDFTRPAPAPGLPVPMAVPPGKEQ